MGHIKRKSWHFYVNMLYFPLSSYTIFSRGVCLRRSGLGLPSLVSSVNTESLPACQRGPWTREEKGRYQHSQEARFCMVLGRFTKGSQFRQVEMLLKAALGYDCIFFLSGHPFLSVQWEKGIILHYSIRETGSETDILSNMDIQYSRDEVQLNSGTLGNWHEIKHRNSHFITGNVIEKIDAIRVPQIEGTYFKIKIYSCN